ncbi:MAG TPA: chemotaxis-specific protein-glutamate methyltransferase CheB [Pirellulales bacterium]|nr:chemotaxis-specific protein-glutamate methyltransferase CheB [Pirellulales bacterium]
MTPFAPKCVAHSKARVMIVEDSSVVQELLRHLIAADPRLEVVACVKSGEEAIRLLDRVLPDVISLDIRLPGMNGLETAQHIMAKLPTPIVVVSASVEADDLRISISALRAGALAVVEKPIAASNDDYRRLGGHLCTQLALMSRVKVVRQRIDRGLRFGKPAPELVSSGRPLKPVISARARPAEGLRFSVLGLAASTGGPGALQTLLTGLNADFPLPIVLVQHIAEGFSDGFISWLDEVVPALSVKVAKAGELLRPGFVYVAPADRHVQIDNCRLMLNHGKMVSGQRPSATVLFASMARSLGPAALAVLLTGMGDDGAAGLKDVFDAGGYTIAEDASTAVVYGMPRAAAQLGAVNEMLPLDKISRRLQEITRIEASPTSGNASIVARSR